MGSGYPPPTPSRQKPLGADFGGSRSIGCTRTPGAESPCGPTLTGACGAIERGVCRVVRWLAQCRNGPPVSLPCSIGPERPREPAVFHHCGLSPFWPRPRPAHPGER